MLILPAYLNRTQTGIPYIKQTMLFMYVDMFNMSHRPAQGQYARVHIIFTILKGQKLPFSLRT